MSLSTMQTICKPWLFLKEIIFQVNCTVLTSYIQMHLKKNCFFVHSLLYMHSLAKQIVRTYMLLCSFLVFVSVGVKHFTRSDGMNQL
jgi:hypothetical protein